MMVLALALAAAPMGWAGLMEPARGGTVDVQAGSGVAFTPRPGLAIPFSPELVLGARWGITDNVQLAFPLLVTGSFTLDLPLAPRFALTAGLAGAGYSNVEGVILVPAVAGTVSLVGKKSAVMLTLDTSVVTGGTDVVTTGAGGVAGWAFQINDRWSAGFSGRAGSSHSEFLDVSIDEARVGIGSHGSGVPADVPTLRLLLDDSWSLELWAYADYAIVNKLAGTVDIGTNFSVTWHLGY